jgi:hypothetical protein
MRKDYAVKYLGPKHLGIKETLKSWEYTVRPQGVQVRIFLWRGRNFVEDLEH